MKKWLISMLCLACVLSLTGCSALNPTDTVSENVPTLAPAVSSCEAPVGFDGMTEDRTVALYLPSRDGQRLLAQYVTISVSRDALPEETVVRALLSYPMNSEVQPLGRGTTVIGLYGQHPVEVSDGVCTVNLSSSILQLDYSEQYTVCLALASTLSALGNVDYVNVLVADQPLSLDITGNLPAGGTAPHPGEELSVLWEQMDARRTPLGQDPSTQPLSSAVTLYFPLSDGSGFVSETRTLSFTGQSADVLTMGLLSALSSGAQYLEGTAAMPDISGLLLENPRVEELADGGRRVHLVFTDNLETRLELLGLDPACFLSAVSCTVLTFVPGVSGVYLYSGDRLLTDVGDKLQTENGLIRRSQLIDWLKVQKKVYLPDGSRLTEATATVSWDLANDPTTVLLIAMTGTAEKGTAAIQGETDETDILGMAIDGDLLLLNLSPRVERLIRQAGAEGEQLTCYSMVNTLCRNLGVKRVCFFFEGEMKETLGGYVYWAGEFRQNGALNEDS